MATFLHVQQIWPVEKAQVAGVYRNPQNPLDTISLQPNGEYKHSTGQEQYFGKWSLEARDGDVSLVHVRFQGKGEPNTPYIVGSRFGRVVNLYVSNKSPEQWEKFRSQ